MMARALSWTSSPNRELPSPQSIPIAPQRGLVTMRRDETTPPPWRTAVRAPPTTTDVYPTALAVRTLSSAPEPMIADSAAVSRAATATGPIGSIDDRPEYDMMTPDQPTLPPLQQPEWTAANNWHTFLCGDRNAEQAQSAATQIEPRRSTASGLDHRDHRRSPAMTPQPAVGIPGSMSSAPRSTPDPTRQTPRLSLSLSTASRPLPPPPQPQPQQHQPTPPVRTFAEAATQAGPSMLAGQASVAVQTVDPSIVQVNDVAVQANLPAHVKQPFPPIGSQSDTESTRAAGVHDAAVATVFDDLMRQTPTPSTVQRALTPSTVPSKSQAEAPPTLPTHPFADRHFSTLICPRMHAHFSSWDSST
jgi:hypothetical protein